MIFSLLLPFIHREGGIGQQARDALLLCMALSASHPMVGDYVAKHSNFCPVSISFYFRLNVVASNGFILIYCQLMIISSIINFLYKSLKKDISTLHLVLCYMGERCNGSENERKQHFLHHKEKHNGTKEAYTDGSKST